MDNPQLNCMNGSSYTTIISVKVVSNTEYLIFKPYLD